ncbi:hypothetical protein [Pedobacter gandavensis]|uniref:hypothetical protein n=1 Tax=Pedobacter gandavensis TaxID=2679963 RepID=UPI00292CC1AA|nr:hypothetical protein [Pedobacter gandavensis]
MKFVNQHSLLNSLYDALTPDAALIDGRTEEDWLRFLSEFATLINFYDLDNSLNGSWEPFLLKDPVFLMAAISGANYTKMYALYLNTCYKLEQLLGIGGGNEDLAHSFNQLFDQLINNFLKIKQWYNYMANSKVDYPLKTYVATQIRTTFGNELQAILSLRKELFRSGLIVGFASVDPAVLEEFSGYKSRIWREGAYSGHYWELLGLTSIKDNSINDIFKALSHVAEALFNFLKVIITQAKIEYSRLLKLKSSFPDTTLLRSFIHLLKVQQAQLNGIADHHLRFYYRDVLMQTERKAVADRAYLVATLTAKDALVSLPVATLFDAGLDAERHPILFESTEEVVLNPAAIPMAYTLSRVPASNELSILQLLSISDPGVLQKDEEGKIMSWNTMGSHEPDPAAQKPLGIAFASPMLLLREGTRNIKICLNYTGTVNLNMIQGAQCYLSTTTDWLEVTAELTLEETTDLSGIIITIALKSTDPAIERFLEHPDGIDSSWPMFKLIFNQVTEPKVAVPVLQAMKIEVSVTDMETFQLYNDYGALSSKVSYPLFGPTPEKGSNFILGSNEIFSKPVESLNIELNWATLPQPPDFSIYYQAYNLYLNKGLTVTKTPDSCWLKNIFSNKNTEVPATDIVNKPYNNTCFVVDFQVLDEKNWESVAFDSNLLFSPDGEGLSSQSTYSSNAIPLNACDPFLQNQPMKFTETSTGGFLKMELTGPDYGFGTTIYPNVVSAVTLCNSQILYNNEDQPFFEQAQLPYTPKLKSFTGCYAASAQYVFNQETGLVDTIDSYPVQAFLYTPFTNYLVYDNLNEVPAQKDTIGDSGSVISDASGIPLYASFNYDGFLYLAIDNLIPASSFNIYFELARTHVSGNVELPQVEYYYLGNEGWAALAVLSDGTHNLSSSGIVSLNIPADISLESSLMPKGCYWIAIVANDISHVAATVLLSTNGISVQRATADPDMAAQPNIPAGTITRTKMPFSKISSIIQPFPSFGKRAAEDFRTMNRRVSHRLKTKDRAVSATDYVVLIKQGFEVVFDAVVNFNPLQKTTNVYVVKSVDHWTVAHAFIPMLSVDEEAQIKLFLQKRTSAFSLLRVMNPEFQKVVVYATISIQPGYEFSLVQQQVMQALNIYLSPWIRDPGLQVTIYEDISDVQIASFIKTIEGVEAVERVCFKTWMYHSDFTEIPENLEAIPLVTPLIKSALFISNMIHEISLNPSAK